MAGWYPGRRAWFTKFEGLAPLTIFSRGVALVQEFGGLHVGRTGSGADQATSDICFYRRPSAADRGVVATAGAVAADLFPLGWAQQRYLDLFVDAHGRLWVQSVVCGSLWRVGDSFADSVERLVLGKNRS